MVSNHHYPKLLCEERLNLITVFRSQSITERNQGRKSSRKRGRNHSQADPYSLACSLQLVQLAFLKGLGPPSQDGAPTVGWDVLHNLIIKKMPHNHDTGQLDQSSPPGQTPSDNSGQGQVEANQEADFPVPMASSPRMMYYIALMHGPSLTKTPSDCCLGLCATVQLCKDL